MQRAIVAVTHQQRMNQALLRRRRWLLHVLLRRRILRRLLRLGILRLLWLLLWLSILRLLWLVIALSMLWRLLLILLRLRCLRLRHHAWGKQRRFWRIINQRFHRRKFEIIERERMRAFRLFAGITRLLRSGKLASQFCFRCGISIVFFFGIIINMRFAVALLLRRRELTRQRILFQRIGFIVGQTIVVVMLITFGFTRGTFFGHTLRRQLNAVGGQLAARWHTNTVRARQLWTNALFHLRTRTLCWAKQRCRRSCGAGCTYRGSRVANAGSNRSNGG